MIMPIHAIQLSKNKKREKLPHEMHHQKMIVTKTIANSEAREISKWWR